MLDKNSLAQLSSLKTAIVDSKDYAEGRVVGSNGRFGFVRLDDGRDAFLNPDKMQHVLPGDRVKVSLTKNDKEQYEASFEKLLEQGIKRFVGVYKSKGKAQFVQPDLQQFNRWLFIPPQQRQKCKENDFVVAELTKHPYDDGKASAKIIARLGPADEPFIEHKLTIAKHGLFRFWSKDSQNQAAKLTNTALDLSNREDYTHIPFVTIDAASTQDMDDAVHAEKTDSGWTLHVAIADPASHIAPGSHLAKAARDFAQTVYLPGETLGMLPDKLATELFSLTENTEKPALVAKICILTSGEVSSFEFKSAKMRSRKKLSYDNVASFISGEKELPIEDAEQKTAIETSLKTLNELAASRREYREANYIVNEDQSQYRFTLDKHGKIESIHPQSRNVAHNMIEEAMLLTNISAGELLAQNDGGIHAVNEGFRAERFGEVKAVLKEEFEGDVPDNLETLEGFVNFIQQLKHSADKRPLLAPLKRMMRSTALSTEALPHMNMGVAHYATISSPIRRYADLSNHWAIHQILKGQKPTAPQQKTLQILNETLDSGRQASREIEQWLKCQYTQSLIGKTFTGTIRIVTQQGFGVRIEENGLEGFVQFGKGTDKTFDAKRMTLTIGETKYCLDTEVSICITSTDIDKRRTQFTLASESSASEPETQATQEPEA